jgi:hypothetical protein
MLVHDTSQPLAAQPPIAYPVAHNLFSDLLSLRAPLALPINSKLKPLKRRISKQSF